MRQAFIAVAMHKTSTMRTRSKGRKNRPRKNNTFSLTNRFTLPRCNGERMHPLYRKQNPRIHVRIPNRRQCAKLLFVLSNKMRTRCLPLDHLPILHPVSHSLADQTLRFVSFQVLSLHRTFQHIGGAHAKKKKWQPRFDEEMKVGRLCG